MAELREVIRKAQAGDEWAKDTLVKLLEDNGAMQQLARYLYRNRLLEPSDVKGEFWLGVAQGMLKVKYNIGNPLQYLIQRGIWQVRTALRRAINRGVIWYCKECSFSGQLRRMTDRDILDVARCPKCGGEVGSHEKFTPLKNDHWKVKQETRLMRLDLDKLKTTFTVHERKVFELIEQGHDRDNSKNYLKDIAKELRVTPQNVNYHLRKIRSKMEQHLREEEGNE